MPRGFVSLVGAGPGDPDLLTVKGLRRLRAADVVAYDALANETLLRECRPDAEVIPVGKRAGQPSVRQEAINALLIDKASNGLHVVRLKGGDPFVFGRGGEEALALQAAGVDWEVVPGISSAIGVPACAGIPVTHRACASSFAVITGHENPERAESRLNWQALAQGVDTLVVLMGIGRLSVIVEQLIAHGRPASTPAAAISHGTLPQQQMVVGSLETIIDAVARCGITSPALLVVGEVVRLHEDLQQGAALPLLVEHLSEHPAAHKVPMHL
jgi:uroporphyrin-III C-methyltransferase